MGVNFDMPEDEDEDMVAKKAAMKSMGEHIGASGGEESEEGGMEDPGDYDPSEGAVGKMVYKKKSKKGGGGKGGMGGGMDPSAIMGMIGGMGGGMGG